MAFLSHPFCFFFFNDTATTEIYTLSLHDALPIFISARYTSAQKLIIEGGSAGGLLMGAVANMRPDLFRLIIRSEEHTSELQSRQYLVCRLLLEKKTRTSISIRLAESSSPGDSITC